MHVCLLLPSLLACLFACLPPLVPACCCGADLLSCTSVFLPPAWLPALEVCVGVSTASLCAVNSGKVCCFDYLLVCRPACLPPCLLERFLAQISLFSDVFMMSYLLLQVSLNRLMHANLHLVAAIYEDKHQLCGFGPQGQLLQRDVKARRVKVRLSHR